MELVGTGWHWHHVDMATRDLGRLASRVKAHRLELYPSRLAAARAAGISKDTWQRVEDGEEVREKSYAMIDRVLGWATGSCILITAGGEPVLGDSAADDTVSAPAAAEPGKAEVVRRAAFEAARTALPGVSIGDIDAFSDDLVEMLKKMGFVADSD